MGILGIEFNIINIILSTFIFGIGDDFSIFIMDGLQNKYRTGQKVLNSHKTAIFFSAFTTVVGMGALVFAKHPALQSISTISILGMIAVVLVAYTIQPLIFRFFIANICFQRITALYAYRIDTYRVALPAFLYRLHRPPYIDYPALSGACAQKQQAAFGVPPIQITCKGIFATYRRQKNISTKPTNASGIRQLSLPTTSRSSTFWYCCLFHLKIDGNQPLGMALSFLRSHHSLCRLLLYRRKIRAIYGTDAEKVKEGYSIAIFPEGTRTYNGKMKRFHKGAFYLAEALKLDILPILLYGNNKIIAKAQPFNIRKGIIYTEILPRIPLDDLSFGSTYRERTKRISAYMKEVYARICREQNTTDNPAFYEALIQNYIYKGPVVEWYIRIKVKMERITGYSTG